VAIVLGLARTVPLLYPWAYGDVVLTHNRLHEALAKSTLHNAVVFGGPGLTNTDPMDLTENLPLDLYPHQDVLIALDKGPESIQCVRTHYPGRSYYRAVPGPVVTFVPF
ncbi:MAG TPA: hypothetical protein VKU41_12880, partial [Polyangiaceae bacterium]|nr:hypothetical protein [Polyangiaceae bacterium]